MQPLKSPYPFFGGKAKVAGEIWKRIGKVDNLVEPFFGSGAFLLNRPLDFDCTETINDADGLICNFWRALQAQPEEVAKWADQPVNENEMHARHCWLVERKQSMQSKLEGDVDWFDVRAAGYWVFGIACWIGSGWCSGRGPWRVIDRQLVHCGSDGQGVNRQLVHCGSDGQGVNRKRVHVGDEGRGVNRNPERLSGFAETSVAARSDLVSYFHELANRLRKVRVCCGDWSRVIGPSVTFKHGLTAVFLDPPYADTAKRVKDLYRVDCERVAHDVREWAIENGGNPLLRICLAGYEGEHKMPNDWEVFAWNAGEGFGGQAKERTGNGKKERLWFSRHCLKSEQQKLL